MVFVRNNIINHLVLLQTTWGSIFLRKRLQSSAFNYHNLYFVRIIYFFVQIVDTMLCM